MSFLGKWFTPKGTGGVEANLRKQEGVLAQAQADTAPAREQFRGFINSGNSSLLPNSFQVPDWMKTGAQVYDANNTLGQTTVNDLFTKNNASMQGDRLRRGMVYGSSGDNSSMADLQNWYTQESAKQRAEALMQMLSTQQGLRGEGGKNYWDIMNFLGNTSAAEGFGNVASQYGQIGANQMASLGSLLGGIGSIAGGIKKK